MSSPQHIANKFDFQNLNNNNKDYLDKYENEYYDYEELEGLKDDEEYNYYLQTENDHENASNTRSPADYSIKTEPHKSLLYQKPPINLDMYGNQRPNYNWNDNLQQLLHAKQPRQQKDDRVLQYSDPQRLGNLWDDNLKRISRPIQPSQKIEDNFQRPFQIPSQYVTYIY